MDSIFKSLNIGHIHPLTGEYILTIREVEEVLLYVERNKQLLVLGGDVLNIEDQYTYLNWYYDYCDSLSLDENIQNSCRIAWQYIMKLNNHSQYHYILVLDKFIRHNSVTVFNER